MSNKYVECWVKTEIVWKIYANLCVTYSDSELNEKWCEMEQDEQQHNKSFRRKRGVAK